MRRILHIFFFVTLLIAGAGCAVYDSTPESTWEESMNDEVFHRAITPFSRIVELSDFYYRYRGIRTDSEGVDGLRNSYFGPSIGMKVFGTEGVEVEYWGRIEPSDNNGEYLAVVSSYWAGYAFSYTVTQLSGRNFTIVYDSSNNVDFARESGYEVTLEAGISAQDSGEVVVHDFELNYTTDYYGKPLYVKVCSGTGDEETRLALCQGGMYSPFPVSGVFYFYLTGCVNENFKVLYYGNHYEIFKEDLLDSDLPV